MEKIKKNFGFGFMRLPMKDGEIDTEETKRMVDAFLDAGFAEAYRQAAENDPKDPYTHRSSERKDW